jgi:hypothetical protein
MELGAMHEAEWRSDIDALVFPLREHDGSCAVHRRAFRTLLKSEPTPDDCLSYFGDFADAFRAAAQGKIARDRVARGTNLHLTSRDVARQLP